MKKMGERDMLKAQVNRKKPRLASSTTKSLFLASFIFLFFIFNSILISAVAPVSEVQYYPDGYTIVEPLWKTFDRDENIRFLITVKNISNGKTILPEEVEECTLRITNRNGNFISLTNFTYNSEYKIWDVEFNKTQINSYFPEDTTYNYIINCENSKGGSLTGTFKITETGDSTEEVDSAYQKESSIILFGILLGILLFVVYLYNREEYYLPMISGIIFLFAGVYSFSVLGNVLIQQISNVIGVLIIGLGLLSLSEAIWRFFPND
jgi:hypothetical protein